MARETSTNKAKASLFLATALLLVVCSAGASDAPGAGSAAAAPDEGGAAGVDRPAQDWQPQSSEFTDTQPPVDFTGIAVPAIVSEPPAAYAPPAGDVPTGLTLQETVPLQQGQLLVPAAEVEPSATESKTLEYNLDFEQPESDAPLAAPIFDSLDFDDNGANTGGFRFIPPDPIGAAGPNHVVNVVNVSIQFHTKNGSPQLGPTGISLQNFFAPLAPVNFTFDPKVIYDQHADRFVVVTLERQELAFGDPADTSRILVAVSDDSDPNGTWYFTAINSKVSISGVNTWADYPGFAVDEEAVYITANMFNFSSSTVGAYGVRLWVIDKVGGVGGGFYGGGMATVSLFDPYAAAGIATTTQPAHIFGSAPTSPNVGTFLVSYSGLSNGTSEFVQTVRVDDPIGPGTPTFSQQFLNIGDIEVNTNVPLPDATQAGTSALIETNDRRALHAVWRSNSLWLTTTIDPSSGVDAGQATAHFWQLDTSNLGAIALLQQGNVGGEDIAPDTHTFFPSIAINDSGDVAIGFAASAETIFASAAYTTRAAVDPPGTTTGSALVRAGLDYYVRTFGSARNRWGDYSGTALDPFDQCFWVYNQYAILRGSGTPPEDGRWGTAYGYFCESCPTNLVLSGVNVSAAESYEARDSLTAAAVTVSGTGDLSLTSQKVILNPGFGVLTGGALSVTIGPCS